MLRVRSTPRLAGVAVTGYGEDIDALADALSNISGADIDGVYKKYRPCSERILTFIKQLRHAEVFRGGSAKDKDGNIESKCYICRVLWPEMIFITALLCDYMRLSESKKYYADDKKVALDEEKARKIKESQNDDTALLLYFQYLVFNELEKTIGTEQFAALQGGVDFRMLYSKGKRHYEGYYTQMVDLVNIRYAAKKPERRRAFLASAAEKLLKPNMDYIELEATINQISNTKKLPYYSIKLDGTIYPAKIEW